MPEKDIIYSDVKFYSIIFGIVVIIAMLITIIVLFTTNKPTPSNLGGVCTTTNNCTTGLVCNSGTCAIPELGSCKGYENYCANGSTCNNGICGVSTPIEPIIPIINNVPSQASLLKDKLLQDEEQLNDFNRSLLRGKQDLIDSICNPYAL